MRDVQWIWERRKTKAQTEARSLYKRRCKIRCAMFGMDDGYMVGPKELIFEVVRQFANGVKEDTSCGLNVRKCKMYNINEGEC